MRGRRRHLAFVPLLALAGACAAAHDVAPKPKLAPAVTAAPPRSRWILTGYEAFRATAYLRTEDGELFFGPRGERLLRTGSALTVAEELLPETIVSAQLHQGQLRLLGTSGTLYVAPRAFGATTAILSPFDGARAASASETALFVLDRAGKLHRSTDGRAWNDVSLPGLVGVVTNVAMAGTGGLVTAFPPQLFATSDEGQTFLPVDGRASKIRELVVDRDSVLVGDAAGWTRFEPPSTFTPSAGPGLWSPRWASPRALVRIDRGRVLELIESGGRTLAVHDLGAPAHPHPLEGIPACVQLDVALSGSTVALRCDDASGATSIFMSHDDGATFALEAKLDVGGVTRSGRAALALGDGGALFVGERCKDAWSFECAPAVARAASGAPFVPFPATAPAEGEQIFAAGFDAKAKTFLALVTDRGRTRLVKTTPRGVDDVATLLPHASKRGTLGFGEDGSAGVVLEHAGGLAAFVGTAAGVKPIAIPALVLRSGALAGTSGLVVSASGRAYETTDAGTWHEVLAPAELHEVSACTSGGCLVDRGLRVGWDGATTAHARPPAMKPGFRCTASGAPTPLGSIGAPPRASALDHGTHAFVLPVRDGDGGVRVFRSAFGDTPEHLVTTELLGPAQPYPAFGSRAVLLTQPGGIVAARYTWKRLHFVGTFNPIALDLAWLRDGETTPHRASVSLPPFKSGTDFIDAAIESATAPELLALGTGGVHWHGPLNPTEPARWFDDRGRAHDVSASMLDLLHDESTWVTGDHDAPRLAGATRGVLTVADATTTRKRVLVPGVAEGERALVFAALHLGPQPEAYAVATQRRAGRSFAFPLWDDTSVELPTQRSLDGVTSCTATTAGEPLTLPWVDGARRPIRITLDGAVRTFVTDQARVRVSGSAIACLSGYDATELDRDGSSLLLFGDGRRAILVEIASRTKGGATLTPLTCTPDPGAPSSAYGELPGVGD